MKSSDLSIYGPRHPRLARAGYHAAYAAMRWYARRRNFLTNSDPYAVAKAQEFQNKLARGEPVYLLGIGPGGHDSGASLIEVTIRNGVKVIANHEEERFTGKRHYAHYPEHSIQFVLDELDARGLGPRDLHACLASFDYVELWARGAEEFLSWVPRSFRYLHPNFYPDGIPALWGAFDAPKKLGEQLGFSRPFPIIGMLHHSNHAYLSWAWSPFAYCDERVGVAVLDAHGDQSSISFYVGEGGELALKYRNRSFWDSAGHLFGMLSACLGGWPIGTSEGRWMGAAAWGDQDRSTNRYYRQLREIVHLADHGQVRINRALAYWPTGGMMKPFTPALAEIVGEPIPANRFFDADVTLNFSPDSIDESVQQRLDLAAATQLVYEDVLFHVVGHLIHEFKVSNVILTGGTALNCLANQNLLDRYDEAYFERALKQKGKRLSLWIPPLPADDGTHAGAAMQFAFQNGGRPSGPLKDPFLCGRAPRCFEIEDALKADIEIASMKLGNLNTPGVEAAVQDLIAFLIAKNQTLGVYHGIGESGRRALGHRSILANPCDPQVRDFLNRKVKYREAFRPVAPMCTLKAAKELFELSPGAALDDYAAYSWMVLAAQAKPEAHAKIPGVIHRDGTARVQVVRRSDPFTYGLLEAAGRRLGVEVLANTSLNVRSPIAGYPNQAIALLKRSQGLHGLVIVGEEGDCYLAWHHVSIPPKDSGIKLRRLVEEWAEESGGGGLHFVT